MTCYAWQISLHVTLPTPYNSIRYIIVFNIVYAQKLILWKNFLFTLFLRVVSALQILKNINAYCSLHWRLLYQLKKKFYPTVRKVATPVSSDESDSSSNSDHEDEKEKRFPPTPELDDDDSNSNSLSGDEGSTLLSHGMFLILDTWQSVILYPRRSWHHFRKCWRKFFSD